MGSIGQLRPSSQAQRPDTLALTKPTPTAPPATGVVPRGEPPPPDVPWRETKLAKLYAAYGPWTGKRGERWRDVPLNYFKMWLGLGPALTGMAIGAAREIPVIGEAVMNPGEAGRGAREKLASDVSGLGAVVAGQAVEAVKHPIRTLKMYPGELTPVVGGLSKLGALALIKSPTGRALLAAEEGLGATRLRGVARGAQTVARTAEVVAKEGPYRPAMRAAHAAAEKHLPHYQYLSDQVRAWHAFQQSKQAVEVGEHIRRDLSYKYFHKHFSGLTEGEIAEWVEAMDAGKSVAEVSPRVGAALHAWMGLPAQTQAALIAMGKLRPDVARRAAFQVGRMKEFGEEIPKRLRAQKEQVAAEAAVAEGAVDDFVRAVSSEGGMEGPISADRVRALGKWLRAKGLKPGEVDPMQLARDIWHREARRAVERGYPRKFTTDFDEAMAQARTGTYVGATAPLFHQIEKIVRGAIGGVEKPFPKGLLGAPAGAEPAAQATIREVEQALSSAKTRKRINRIVHEAMTDQELADEAIRLAGGRDPELVFEGLESGKISFSDDVVAAVLERDEAARLRAGQIIEERLKVAQRKAFEPRQPTLRQMEQAPENRAIWQMTREEWEGLPKNARAKKVMKEVAGAEDPYTASVEYAIRSSFSNPRHSVPREVLAQNHDWELMALSSPSRRLQVVTDELAAKLAAKGIQEPIYYPHLADPLKSPERVSTPFVPGGKYRMKSLRTRTGKTYASGAFIKDPRILGVHVTRQFYALQKAEDLWKRIVTDPRIHARRITRPDQLGPGEGAWSPVGIQLWRSEIDFTKKFVDALKESGVDAEGVERSLAKALSSATDENAFRATEYGFRKPEIYALPQSVITAMKASTVHAPPWVSAIYDAPTAIWRIGVLALRPAWISNNILGNVTFSLLHGVAPRHYIMALQERYRAKTPDTLNGIELTSAERAIGDLLDVPATDPWLRFQQWLNQKPTQTNVAELFKDPLAATAKAADIRYLTRPINAVKRAMEDFNRRVESYFRTANFYKEAEKSARIQYVQRTGDSFLKAFNVLDEMDTLPPAAIDDAIRLTNRFMHDYQNLLPFERAFLRRAFPFYNFLKLQTRLVMGLPIDYPGRMTAVMGLVSVGRDIQAYDNSLLPEKLRDKGLAYLGFEFTVMGRDGKPHRLRAFTSSTGWNPLIIGYNPGSTAAGVGTGEIAGGLGRLGYSQLNPLAKYGLSYLRPGFDIQTGRPNTRVGVVEFQGKFYNAEKALKLGHVPEAEVGPPWIGNPAEALYGTLPQPQLLRHLINPMAGPSADPLSFEDNPNAKGYPTRTKLTELLRYFTSASIILVDQDNLDASPISGRDFVKFIYKAAYAEARRKEGEQARLPVRAPADTTIRGGRTVP